MAVAEGTPPKPIDQTGLPLVIFIGGLLDASSSHLIRNFAICFEARWQGRATTLYFSWDETVALQEVLLKASGRPLVIVAHSWGAYSALAAVRTLAEKKTEQPICLSIQIIATDHLLRRQHLLN